MDAAVLYTLLIVTMGADVKQTPGFETKAMCEEALSLAQTGMTVAEVRAGEERRQARLAKEKEEWRFIHPPRVPKTAEDHNLVAELKKGARFGNCGAPFDSRLGDDGLIYEDPPMCSTGHVTMSFPTTIKYARCIAEPK